MVTFVLKLQTIGPLKLFRTWLHIQMQNVWITLSYEHFNDAQIWSKTSWFLTATILCTAFTLINVWYLAANNFLMRHMNPEILKNRDAIYLKAWRLIKADEQATKCPSLWHDGMDFKTTNFLMTRFREEWKVSAVQWVFHRDLAFIEMTVTDRDTILWWELYLQSILILTWSSIIDKKSPSV